MPFAAFEAGGFRRFFLGENYRRLWIQPIQVARADLGGSGGGRDGEGLRAVERGEADRSRPFVLKAPDGRVYGFRALVKDATLDWPKRLRTTVLRRLGREQISGTVPGGAVVAARISRAAGLLEFTELVILPDDPRLGEWRTEYAHVVGTLEPRLLDSDLWLAMVPGAKELIDSDSLFERLRRDPGSRVDAQAYLTARLVDLLVGDWDRHAGQWVWVRFEEPEGSRWSPIPTDRDWAFNRIEGLVWSALRMAQPKFQKYDGSFSGWRGLLIRAEPLDRRLLTSLDKATWDSVVRQFVARLNDRAIASAVAALPSGMDSAGTAWLRQTLEERRDRLPEVADAFYRGLASVVEVWATDSVDRIRLNRLEDGQLQVVVERGGKSRARWTRKFVPEETKEVRIYTLGGDDALEEPPGAGPIRVRIIREAGAAADPEAMPRDWGGGMGFVPWISHYAGMGFLLGGGPTLTRYGLGRFPYASRLRLRAGYSTGTKAVNADFEGDFRFGSKGAPSLLVEAQALPGSAVHYFGLGNETERSQPSLFYILHQESYRVEPRLVLGTGTRTEFWVGGTIRMTKSDEDRPTLALAEQPYGFGSFTAIGAVAGADLDGRDDPVYPVRGVRARAAARYFPAMADVIQGFGVVEGVVTGYLGTKSLPATPVLAVRAGGSQRFGDGAAPFFEAPALGGKSSLRGYSSRRFLGDGVLFGAAELRLNFGGFKVLLPGEWGVYGLADIGRVYRDGESSTLWHKGWGSGLWLSFVDRNASLSVTYASGERGRVYVTGGWHF